MKGSYDVPKLIMMVGLPRSGKSTWIKENKTNEVVISADDIRYLVYNQQFWGDGEPLMWSIRGIMLRYLLQQGVDVIIDETNTTKERRKPILKLAKQYGYHVIGNVVECAPETCIERAKMNSQENLLSVIERMTNQFELPETEEGFNELNMV